MPRPVATADDWMTAQRIASREGWDELLWVWSWVMTGPECAHVPTLKQRGEK